MTHFFFHSLFDGSQPPWWFWVIVSVSGASILCSWFVIGLVSVIMIIMYKRLLSSRREAQPFATNSAAADVTVTSPLLHGEDRRVVHDVLNQSIMPEDIATITTQSGVSKEWVETNLKLSVLSEKIGREPDVANNYHARGNVYVTFKQFEEALSDFGKAIELNPGEESFFVSRGECFLTIGKIENAIDDFSAALRITPNAVTYNSRGIAYRNINRIELSIKDFSEAVRLNPTEYIYFENRASCYNALENPNRAVTDYTFAIELWNKSERENPEDAASLHFSRGRTLFTLNKNTAALNDFVKCLELNTTYVDGYYYSALVLVRQKMKKRAVEMLNVPIDNELPFPEVNEGENGQADLEDVVESTKFQFYELRGMLNFDLQRYEPASSDLSVALGMLQRVEAEDDDDDEGEAYFTTTSTFVGIKTKCLKIRALAYFRLNRMNPAVADWSNIISLERSLKTKRHTIEAYNQRATCFFELRNYDDAARDFTVALKQVLKEKPRNMTGDQLDVQAWKKRFASTNFGLGSSLLELERYGEAIVALNSAIEVDGKKIKYLDTRAKAYMNSDKIQEAIEDLKEIERIDPSMDTKETILILQEHLKQKE